MAIENWNFEMDLCVLDKDRLLAAAQRHPDGPMMGPLIVDGEVDVKACLMTILDQAVDGCEILGSDAQFTGEG